MLASVKVPKWLAYSSSALTLFFRNLCRRKPASRASNAKSRAPAAVPAITAVLSDSLALDWLAAADNDAVTDDVKSVVKTIKVEDDVVELFDEDEELFAIMEELFDDDVTVVGAGVVGRDSPQEYTAEEFPQVKARVAVLSIARNAIQKFPLCPECVLSNRMSKESD